MENWSTTKRHSFAYTLVHKLLKCKSSLLWVSLRPIHSSRPPPGSSMLRQKGQVSRDFMEVVPSVVIVEDLYKCKVDRDKDYDQMDQEGKVTSLDPCNHGFSMDKSQN